MDTPLRVLIVSGPGHYRDSLVALLRTIPRADLTLADGDTLSRIDLSNRHTPSIVLVDLDSCAFDALGRLASIKESCPAARYLILVDNLRQSQAAQGLGVDCVLPKSASAGEFLMAIRQLSSGHDHILKPRHDYAFLPAVDRMGSGIAGR